jgi:NAD(P)-dependent dehydrogenase (short-subunit alcohol dehydrogenase family)
MKPKTILITGCSAHGIGAALALSLAKRGYHIFATARSPANIPTAFDLAAECDGDRAGRDESRCN